MNYDSETASTSAGNASGGSAGNSTGGVSDKTSGGIFTKTTSGRCADEWAMRIIHIRELDSCIFPLLSAISILSDMVKRKYAWVFQFHEKVYFLFGTEEFFMRHEHNKVLSLS